MQRPTRASVDKEGDRLLVTVLPDGIVQLVSWASQLDRPIDTYADIEPERLLSDELLAERRAAARRESET